MKEEPDHVINKREIKEEKIGMAIREEKKDEKYKRKITGMKKIVEGDWGEKEIGKKKREGKKYISRNGRKMIYTGKKGNRWREKKKEKKTEVTR